MELDCFTYKMLIRDAFVEKMSKTEYGREYLQKCYNFMTKEADVDSLREAFGD